jgi:choline transport protein
MYIGVDASMHLAEECKEPERTIPTAILGAIAIGFLTSFPFSIANLYAISDFDKVLTSTEYYFPTELATLSYCANQRCSFIPLYILQVALRSDTLAVIITVLMSVMFVFSLNAILETSARMTWVLARDDALIGSKKMSQIHPRLDIPLNALLVTWVILCICGVVYVASTTGKFTLGRSREFQDFADQLPQLSMH